MGIRPRFYIIIGIDDLRDGDPRHVENVDTSEVRVTYFEDKDWGDDKELYGNPKFRSFFEFIDEIAYNPSGDFEYACNNTVGMILHKGPYDDDTLRALATIDDKYLLPGSQRIPTLEGTMSDWEKKRYGYNEEDLKCNRCVSGVLESSPQISRHHWKRAKFYLRQAGWEIPEEQLRYLLVWDWS